ncbi:glycoside hydrolase family 1 protein [Patescibacteria group bacterium]|nr:glycoside hydrolase family 1 protein [Patescibacteria group bacterium]MBU1868349.1 glycoside hydrolase family 1 protein [Patescibacteria group bacterium]
MKSDFLWGCATSAHQVEGGNYNNDWWDFEQRGLINDASSSHPSCDHYHRFTSDVELLANLGCNAYRFSVEWSRVQPAVNRFSVNEIDHYHRLLDALIGRGITPVLTLHHFTNPMWFVEGGGWEKPEAVDLFGRYVQRMVDEYTEKVGWWVTLNEPNVLLLLGFLVKYWPPQKKSLASLTRAFLNLIRAHKLAYQIIHGSGADNMVSIADHMSVIDPWKNNGLDNLAAWIYDSFWNQMFLKRIVNHLDYIGLNYYTRQRVSFPFRLFPTPGKEAGFAQWEIYPEGLLRTLRRLKSYKLPVIISEYGMPQEANIAPEEYLKQGINNLKLAMNEGIDVRGFFYWSLLDNFEWREGLSKRFGLYEVDYETQDRWLREVGRVYQELIRG